MSVLQSLSIKQTMIFVPQCNTKNTKWIVFVNESRFLWETASNFWAKTNKSPKVPEPESSVELFLLVWHQPWTPWASQQLDHCSAGLDHTPLPGTTRENFKPWAVAPFRSSCSCVRAYFVGVEVFPWWVDNLSHERGMLDVLVVAEHVDGVLARLRGPVAHIAGSIAFVVTFDLGLRWTFHRETWGKTTRVKQKGMQNICRYSVSSNLPSVPTLSPTASTTKSADFPTTPPSSPGPQALTFCWPASAPIFTSMGLKPENGLIRHSELQCHSCVG